MFKPERVLLKITFIGDPSLAPIQVFCRRVKGWYSAFEGFIFEVMNFSYN